MLPATERSSRLLVASLLAAAVAALVALPLPWHQREIPGPRAGLELVNGLTDAPWLIAIAAICLLFALRFLLTFPGFYTKWLVTLFALAVVLAMSGNSIGAQSAASQLNSHWTAFNGSGFFLGVAVVPLVLLAVILAWRTANPL